MTKAHDSDWHRITHFLSLVLTTGALSDERPKSVLIVGPPGTGKTELVKRFGEPEDPTFNPTCRIIGNLSSWGLRNFLRMEVPRGASHVIVPEFQTLFMRRADTWQGVQGLLLQALDEGVGDYYNGPVPENYGGARIGMLGAMTRDAYLNVREDLTKTGFLSRFLTLRWTRTRRQIEDSLRKGARGELSELKKVRLRLPTTPALVRVPERVSNVILDYTRHHSTPEQTSRDYRRWMAFTKSAALQRGARIAALRDWSDVLRAEPFWIGEV